MTLIASYTKYTCLTTSEQNGFYTMEDVCESIVVLLCCTKNNISQKYISKA